MKIKTLILTLFTAFLFLFLSGCTSNNTDNNSLDENWLENYTPEHSVGNDENDFWINFPDGQSADHLMWIIESLEEKPIFFVCHRTGCASCTPQADRVKTLGETYAGDAVFYDLDDPFPGYGDSSTDILEKYNEAFYYDPNGGTHYIALTGVFTLVNDGGEVKIGWHSWEGNVDDSEMESWVKDIIYYYYVNK